MNGDFSSLAVKARFINTVLKEEGSRMWEQQGRQIALKTRRRTGNLYERRRIAVFGGNGQFDGMLSFTHSIYERFLDMKRLSDGRKSNRNIHNRYVMRAYGRIAGRLMNDFTEETKADLQKEFEAIRSSFVGD